MRVSPPNKFVELPWVSCFTGECDVMVNELAPDNQQHRYSMVMEAFILETFHATYICWLKVKQARKLQDAQA